MIHLPSLKKKNNKNKFQKEFPQFQVWLKEEKQSGYLYIKKKYLYLYRVCT